MFSEDATDGLRFHPAPPPSDDEVARLLATIRSRALRLLRRRGLAGGEDPTPPDPLAEESLALAGISSASVLGRIALGRRAGARVWRLGHDPDAPWVTSTGPRQAHLDGFDLHGNVWVPATNRAWLDDALIVHEPAEDLPGAIYWRMGVPAWQQGPVYGVTGSAWLSEPTECFKRWQDQPVLGSIGFPFPWKHYDKLAEVTRAMGWALLLIAPNATDEQVTQWRAINPDLYVRTTFVPRREAISLLAGCDATAFLYVTQNTGQSGAMLQGIAARKPVIALKTCRQFRALYEDPIGRATIKWAETFEDVAAHLRGIRIQRVDPGIVALAEQESWTKLGQKYAALYKEVLR